MGKGMHDLILGENLRQAKKEGGNPPANYLLLKPL